MTHSPPVNQCAVQLVGPDELRLNREKPVHTPGPHQLLCRVEVVGLCFSDLKLLKQFSGHVRKSEVVGGIEPRVLNEVPNYVPGEAPTVPGHEAVVRVVEVGEKVSNHKVDDRFLVQADWRHIQNAETNAAFGYNFEGALQEYVLLDERLIMNKSGESMLLPASEDLPASAVALVEPWACVEDSYVVEERIGLREGGHLLVVAGHPNAAASVKKFLQERQTSGRVSWIGPAPKGMAATVVDGIEALKDDSVDDLLFFGGDAGLLEAAFKKVAAHGLVLLVQCGTPFGRPVVTPVGRLHYGGMRIAGTPGDDPAAALESIPASGEIREGDRINVVGAGGPMGTMHVIRNLCQGVEGISMWAGDMSDERLAVLSRLAEPLADHLDVSFQVYHAETNTPRQQFDYTALMVPAPALVATAVAGSSPRGIINIFAGIPVTVEHPLDLDIYADRQLYFIGTSGSDMRDMKIVLNKVATGTLDTNLSVGAVSGLDGAVDGIRAVEKQAVPGKIIVYPSCRGLPLTRLSELDRRHPEVAGLLKNGTWCQEAETKLIELYKGS